MTTYLAIFFQRWIQKNRFHKHNSPLIHRWSADSKPFSRTLGNSPHGSNSFLKFSSVGTFHQNFHWEMIFRPCRTQILIVNTIVEVTGRNVHTYRHTLYNIFMYAIILRSKHACEHAYIICTYYKYLLYVVKGCFRACMDCKLAL